MTPQPAAAARLTLDPATTDETLATIFGALRRDPDRTPAQRQTQREAGAALIAALRPRNPVEAAYAVRAAAAHYGAMECFRRTMLPDTPDNAGIRWDGKAVALSRMNKEMIRTLRECQAATPRAQAPAQPAARPAVPRPPAPAAAARPAAGRPAAAPADKTPCPVSGRRPRRPLPPSPPSRPRPRRPSAAAARPAAAVAAEPAGGQHVRGHLTRGPHVQ